MFRARTILAWGCALLTVQSPSLAGAQQTSGRTGIERSRTADSPSNGAGNQSDRPATDGEESPDDRRGIREFEDVQVERMRPSELPPPMETELPKVLKGADRPTGTPPSREELRSTADRVRRRTHRLVALREQSLPGDTALTVRTGHAVRLRAPQGEMSFLVTTYFWLKDARELYLVPSELTPPGDSGNGPPTAARRSLDEVTISLDDQGQQGSGWIAEHRDQLVPARLFRPDRDRNLVAVVPGEQGALEGPAKGLPLFDLEEKSPTWLYGFSPSVHPNLQTARVLPSHPDDRSLAYYLQSTFPANYGAPIVSPDGSVLVLTAFPNPDDQSTSLVIPPEPLATYLSELRESARD
ncbi:MAG: hypothetical protein ABEL76_06770 [Bradymonadaceae bacterium]